MQVNLDKVPFNVRKEIEKNNNANVSADANASIFSQEQTASIPEQSILLVNYQHIKPEEEAIIGPQLPSGIDNTIPNGKYLNREGKAAYIADQINNAKSSEEKKAVADRFFGRMVNENDKDIVAMIGKDGRISDDVTTYISGKMVEESEFSAYSVAKHNSEYAESVQAEVVKQTQKVKDLYGEEAQKNIDEITISQYDKFGKKSQVEIHKVLSNSEIKETVEKAAQNIYKLAEENREAAVEITKATGNEKAIEAIQTVEPKKVEVASNKQTAQATQTSKVDFETAVKSGNSEAVKVALESMTSTELRTLVSNDTSLIATLLSYNLNTNQLEAIDSVLAKSNKVDYKVVSKEIAFLTRTQDEIVKQAKDDKNLNSINENFLTLSVRRKFNEYQQKQYIA